MAGKWKWSIRSQSVRSTAARPRSERKPPGQRALELTFQELEQRTLLSVTASLKSGVLDINLSAAGDSAMISPSGASISVSGTGDSGALFSGVTAIVVVGTNTPATDAPGESVTFEGSGGTIALNAAAGTAALSVSGVTAADFTDVTIQVTTGDVAVMASETTSTTTPEYAPQASVAVQAGAVITADNVRLDANATSSYTYSASLAGALNQMALGVAAAIADLAPSATVTVEGSSTKIAVNGSSGDVTIGSDASATVASTPTAGTDVAGSALNPADASVAFSVVNSSAITDVGGGSSVSAGTGSGTLSITSTNTTNVTTTVTASSIAGGATAAVTLDNSVSQATVDGGSSAQGGTVDVLASTTNAATTSASSTALGAGTNSAIQNILAGKVDPDYLAAVDPPPDKYSTSPAETAETLESGGLPITVAGAVAVTKFTPATQAGVDASTVTATKAINIDSSASNSTSTTATGSTTTSNAATSVGVAVAISDTDVSTTATVGNTAGTTSLTAPTILVQAGTPTATAATPDLSTLVSATSGVYATGDGVAGALALNLVSNTTEASEAQGSTVSIAGGNNSVTFNAQDTASETAMAQPPGVFTGGQAGGGFGLGAAVVLNIDSNTTLAELQNSAQLTGADNLAFTAGSSDTVATNAVFGSSGGLGSIDPSAAITVVTNTTDAQVGTPDPSNAPLVVGGALSATATHAALTSTAAGASSGSGSGFAVGVAIALAFATDQTTATTGRSIDAKGGGVTFEADGSAASLVSSIASASGGPTNAAEAAKPSPGKVDTSEEGPGSDTSDPNSVDGQNAQQRNFADSESGTLTDSNGNAVSPGNTKNDAKTPAASTSDGSVTVAAAVAVNIVSSTAVATVPAGLTITAAGPLSVTATNDTGNAANPMYLAGTPGASNTTPNFGDSPAVIGDTANAWGTAGGTSTVGVGAAIALNLVNTSTEATIQAATTASDGVTVNAGMMGTSPMNLFGATATSGAGASDIGVAGAVAINIVNNTSQALIETGAAVSMGGGDVSVTSLNNESTTTFAVPVSAATGGRLGIGASLALNIITDTTQSEVQDNAALTDAGNATVTAGSSHTINTWAQNGGAGKVALGAGIAILLANAPTTASVGADTQTLTASGNLTIGASGSFLVTSVAAAATNPSGILGLGASVVVNLAQDSFKAELHRNVNAGGAVSVTASPATASSQATAIASVEGAPASSPSSGQGSSTGSGGTADQETQNQSTFAKIEGGSDLPSVPALPTANSELTGGASSPASDAKSDSGGDDGATAVGIAASVAVNVLTTSTVALIDNSLTVTAGGALTVGTVNQSSALALADSRATKNLESIGAAVSLNVATVTNKATIGTGDTISADGVNVTALMATDTSGAVTPNDVSTQAIGVAVGMQAGVAGSAGINVINLTTEASIGAGCVVTSSGGLTVQSANDETLQNIAYTGAEGGEAGVGAAISVNVLTNSTTAFLDTNVQANVGGQTQVTAESSLTPSTDLVPNSPADAVVATGSAVTAKTIPGVSVYELNNINASVIGIATAPLPTGLMITPVPLLPGPGIPAGTAIVENDSKTGTVLLVLGSSVVTSDALALLDPLDPPEIGDTVTGPGIAPGTTLKGFKLTLAGGMMFTLSLPVIASGSASITLSHLAISDLADPARDLTSTTPLSLIAAPTSPDDIVEAGIFAAIAKLAPTSFASGYGLSSGGAGIAGSFIINVIKQATQAYIGSRDLINTRVNLAGYPTAGDDEGVNVSASEMMNLGDWAGAIGQGDNVGFGAALDVNVVSEDDEAYIASSATVDAAQNVTVEASSSGSFQSITAAAAAGGSVGIAGAAAFEILTPTTRAYIDQGTTVGAAGNLLVQANRQATIDTTAGQLSASGDASIGAASSTIDDTVNTDAYLAPNDVVTAHGTSGTGMALTGNASGDATPFSGVAVVAATFPTVQAIVVGGAVSGGLGLAGSVAVNDLNNTTLAYVGAGATVTASGGTPGNGPGLIVTAADPLSLFTTAGALAAGGDAGLGAGVNVDKIVKNTQAYIATATVSANGNVLVQARSAEKTTSITAMVGASGTVAIDGSGNVYVLNITTRAFIGNDPMNPTAGATSVQTAGSLVVEALDSTLLNLLSGNLSGSGTLSVGVAASVPVITKTTEAFIGAGASVGALGLGTAVNAETGQFTITYGPYSTAPGVAQPSAETADLTGTGSNSITSPRLGQARIATPQTEPINGLAVTAVNADELQGVGVTGGISGTAAADLSGSVAVLTSTTDASIGTGAKINSSDAGAAIGQSVLVAAGNDMSFLGIAGSLALAGDLAFAPGVVVLVVKNTTTASIEDGASVNARADVDVDAHSSGDVLTIAAAAAASGTASLGGAVSFVGIFDTTQANIGDSAASTAAGALVDAGGNVLVDASDDTVAYLITGALGVGVGAAGLGGAVSIVDLSKTTDAFIGSDTTVNALGNTSSLLGILDGKYTSGGFEPLGTFHGEAVQASSSENVTNVAAAGALGFYAGLAGAVSIELFSSTTQAYIGSGAQINTSSVQSVDSAVGNSTTMTANAAQSVNVAAVNQAADSLSFSGAVSGGIAGIAGGIDIGLLQNATTAYIGSDADVQALQDVDVFALANDSVDTIAVGAALGAVAAVGSVSVWAIGQAYSAAYSDDEKNTAQAAPLSGITASSNEAESQTGVASAMVGSLTSSAGNAQFISSIATSNQGGVTSAIAGDPVASAIESTAVSPGTEAFIGAGATIQAGGNVNVLAKSQVSYTGLVGGLGVGAVVGIGASIELANIQGTTQASIDQTATVKADGNLTVDAELVKDTATGKVFAGTGGIIGALRVQVVVIEDTSTEMASVDNAAIPQASQVRVSAASDDRSLDALAIGGSVGLVGVGTSIAHAYADGSTTAQLGGQIGQTAGDTVGAVTVSATANDSASAQSNEVVAGVLAGAGAAADATVDPDVTAQVSDGSLITATGTVTVNASLTPNATVNAFGVDAGPGVSIGVITSSALVDGTTSAMLCNGISITSAALVVDANRTSTTQSSATAGVGGLIGGNATLSSASSNGTVEATTERVNLVVSGDITFSATSTSNQSASANGTVVGALLGVGVDEADASSAVVTKAQLGGGTTTAAGTLNVNAAATDKNNGTSTANSGGVLAGDASIGKTSDKNSMVLAEAGGKIAAGTVNVSALNQSVYSPNVNSLNAAVFGGSGAAATNTDTIAANAMIDSGTTIMASFAVNLSAQNTFQENLPFGGNSVTAGSGGLATGAAATSTTTLTGNANVDVGDSVKINVETPTAPTSGNPGIFMAATSNLNHYDQAMLSAGGLIAGAGTNSSLTATLNNHVTIASTTANPDDFVTNQNIGIGSYTIANAGTASSSSTTGLGAVAAAIASTTVTSNQTVTVDPGTTMTAFFNINLTPGDNPLPATGTNEFIQGASNAQSYARGFIAVPAASATTLLTSNATLTVSMGDLIQSGADTTLAADPRMTSPLALATGHGYELGFIPVTDGSSSGSGMTSSTMTIDGTVEGGIYHELNITIPNAQNMGIYSSIVNVNPDGSPFANFAGTFNSSFNPSDLIGANFSGVDQMALDSNTSSAPVGAVAFSPLYAAGGDVTVDAGQLQGNGSIIAYGAPTITVTNDSPDYLDFSTIEIPDLAYAQVNFTGAAGLTGAQAAGITVSEPGAGVSPVITIQDLYSGTVGTPSFGPAIFFTGDVDNLTGSVTITNNSGSVGVAASINAQTVNINVPNGVLVYGQQQPGTTTVTGQSPFTAWTGTLVYPGGDPSQTSVLDPNVAIAYVANALYNTQAQYGTNSLDLSDDESFTQALIGLAGQTPPASANIADITLSQPATISTTSAISLMSGGVELQGILTAGSPVVIYVTNQSELSVGQPVTGSGIPGGTTISSLGAISGEPGTPQPPAGEGNIYLSLPATQTSSGAISLMSGTVEFQGIVTAGSTVVTVLTNLSQLAAGQPVSGSGIGSGTTIVSAAAPEGTIYLTLPATATTSSPVSLMSGAVAFQGVLTAGSTMVTVLTNLPKLAAGQPVSGSGIPSAATIESTAISPGSIFLSQPATSTPSGPVFLFSGAVEFQGIVTGGSELVTVLSNLSQLVPGQPISGSGIPTGTTIGSIAVDNGASLEFLGDTTGDNIQYTITNAESDSPIDAFYEMDSTAGRGNFPVVPVELLYPSAETYPSTPVAGSSINANAVLITAQSIDIDSPITVGQSSSSVFLGGAQLASTISSDQNDYNAGIPSSTATDPPGDYTLPVTTITPGDHQITAYYDAQNQQIDVNDVNAASNGAFVYLNGAILSTNTMGNIHVNGGAGQVTINNQTGLPLVVNNVSAGTSTSAVASLGSVEIVDTRQDDQNLYVYQPGPMITDYSVSGTTTWTIQQLEQITGFSLPGGGVVTFLTQTKGNSTTYQPQAGLAFQWQLQANLARTVTAVSNGTSLPTYNETSWTFQTAPGEADNNNPWYYLDANGNPTAPTPSGTGSTPFGYLVTGVEAIPFSESITGSVGWEMFPYLYHSNHFNFNPTDPPVSDSTGQADPWAYYFATTATLTLTNTVKADNPIGISFSGSAQAGVTITSDAPVIINGDINNPLGPTVITGTSVTQTPTGSINSSPVTITATDPNGMAGTIMQPLIVSLPGNGPISATGPGGVSLILKTGANLNPISAPNGNVNVMGDGPIGGPGPITGNNISVSTPQGPIGSLTTPLDIIPAGPVNIMAPGNIVINQPQGPMLEVDQICSTHGDVTVTVAQGSIVSANDAVVTAFQNEVNNAYSAYWQLVDNGVVQNGNFTLNSQAVPLYVGPAEAALNVSNPSVAQVQGYVNSQYQAQVAFFTHVFGSSWMGLPQFLVFSPFFQYTATPGQIANLGTDDGYWTLLPDPIADVALNPQAGTPVETLPYNICGNNVTINTGTLPGGGPGSIGQISVSPPIDIPLPTLQSAPLPASLQVTVINSYTPGDIVPTYSNGVITGVQVTPTVPLLVMVNDTLNTKSPGPVIIQSTSPNLPLGQVISGSPTIITSPGSITSNGTGPQIITPGPTTLKAGTGPVGSSTMPIIVNSGHPVQVFAPPGQSFVNNVAPSPQPLIPTQTAVISNPPASSTFGTPVTFTATVTATSGTSAPTGSIEFFNGTTDLGPGTPLQGAGISATSTFTTSTLPAGNDPSIIAVYTPTGSFTGSHGSTIFVVTPPVLTITADSTSKTYGQTLSFAGTEFQFTGLLSGDSVTSVTETSAGAAASAMVGTDAIVPSAASGTGLSKYTIVYVNGTLTVNPATLTITADNESKTYGQAFVRPTAYSETGLVTANGDTITNVTATDTGAAASAPVGMYNIVPTTTYGTGLSNYTITYVSGMLTVNQAALVITADDASKIYGQTATFDSTAFTETGLDVANGDTITGVTETSAGAPASAPAGSDDIVPIAAIGSGIGNYTISYLNGTLTIDPVSLTITAVNESKSYGTTFTPDGTTQFTTLGLLNGDSVTSVTLESDGYAATATVAPGPTYSIDPSAAVGTGLGNYTINYVSGTLTVDPAALTITASDESKTYGTTFVPDGTTQLTTQGLVSGDSVTSVTLASGGYASTASVVSPGPNYAIMPFAAVGTGLGNYTITYVSGTLTVNPAPLTITADNASKVYGQTAMFASTAFTETGLVTANGDTLTGVTETSTGAPNSATVVAPGPHYAIAPSAAVGSGLGNYTITYVSGTLTVNPAPLTITATNETKTYGTTFVPDGTTQFTTQGLQSGDSVASMTLTSSGYAAAATVVLPGPNYAIVPSAALGTDVGNYTITYVNGRLTVNPAVLTITADDESKTYGITFAPGGTTQFTTNGLVNGDSVTNVTLTSTGYAAAATVTSPGPNYAIVPLAAVGTGLSNYTINFVNGTLTVDPAPLTITASDGSKTYGQSATLASTAFSETGLLTALGDTITGVTETSSGAPASTSVNTYAIVPSAATGTGLSNYTISYVNGTLTVLPAALMITADDEIKTYGTTFTPDETTQFTILGLLNGDSVTSVTLTSSGDAATASVESPGPNYAIVPSAAAGTGLGDYTIRYVSGVLSVNPAALTISANNGSKPYGQTPNLPSTAFTETGLVTASGDTVGGVTETSTGAPILAPVSTYPIVPSAAIGNGLGNYTISYVNGTLTVNAAVLTITADDESKTYGTTFTPNGTTQFTTSGLLNGDSVTSLTLSSPGYASAATVVSPGPNYAITPRAAVGIGLNNYTITYISGAFTVNPAPLTITAANESKTYGTTFSPDRTTQFTTIGLANNDSVTSVTLTSTGYASAATVIGVGPKYAIIPSAAAGSGLGNYTITYRNGTLTVNPARLTITANNARTTSGQTVTFAPTAFGETGLVTANGDSIRGVTETSPGAPESVAGTTVAIVPAAATGIGLGNYTIDYVSGTLTVNRAPLSTTSNVAPTVTSMERFGFHEQPTSVVLTFSAPLDPASAENVDNYRIVTLGGPGRGGSLIGHVTKVSFAVYDPASLTVTLYPVNRLDVHNRYQITVKGSAGGMTKVTGTPLAGDIGQPATDYVAVISRSTLDGPAPGAALSAKSRGLRFPGGLPALRSSAGAADLPTIAGKHPARVPGFWAYTHRRR
jgi:hypothetical protein